MKLLIAIRDFLRWVIRVLGSGLLEDIVRMNEFNLSTAFMHRHAFLPYKDKFTGKDVVILATGPSLNDYQPIPDAVTIGVNLAFKFEKCPLDFLFVQDRHERTRAEIDEIVNYRPDACTKFFGLASVLKNDSGYPISESDAIKAKALRYRTDNFGEMRIERRHNFQLDISTQPLADFGTVVFAALQFALWTNPARIFLVGCDCTRQGHFNSTQANPSRDTDFLTTGYLKFKEFAENYYPATEIVSVNPVGLKGMFKDLYQK